MLDTAPLRRPSCAAVPAHARAAGGRSPRACTYVAWLRAHGVPVHSGVRLLACEGERARRRRRAGTTAGASTRSPAMPSASATRLRSETQLADLLGCALRLRRRCTAPGCRSATPPAAPASPASTSPATAPASWAPTRPSGPASCAALALLADRRRAVIDTAARRRAASSSSDAARRASASGLETRLSLSRRLGRRMRPTTWSSAAARKSPPASCAHAVATPAPTRSTGSRRSRRVGMGRCQGRMCGVGGGRDPRRRRPASRCSRSAACAGRRRSSRSRSVCARAEHRCEGVGA